MRLKCVDCGEVNYAFFKGEHVKKEYDNILFMLNSFDKTYYIKVHQKNNVFFGIVWRSKAINNAYYTLPSIKHFTCVICDANVTAIF